MLELVEPNLKLTKIFLIKEDHSAKKMGSGQVEVLSTPSMICFMEQTSLECVQSKLPDGFITVGVKIDVKHLWPVPIGANLKVTAKKLEFNDRKLRFSVEAIWQNILIGQGIHERFIVNKANFLQKMRKTP